IFPSTRRSGAWMVRRSLQAAAPAAATLRPLTCGLRLLTLDDVAVRLVVRSHRHAASPFPESPFCPARSACLPPGDQSEPRRRLTAPDLRRLAGGAGRPAR